ncbi:helix-turn-helix transcriptional regulator [Paracoccus litorisediminis]|uniref:helix-turn-helix transcriptional regulator n=1 Tax=Paracoccus litorisediminis TaxID=2006130 RepID=UPI003734A8FE
MGNEPAEETIERIYEAAMLPELWPHVLHDTARHVGADGGALFVASEAGTRWTSSVGMFEAMRVFVDDGWTGRNPRGTRLSGMNYPGFVRDLDLFTHEEIARDPFYTEFCPAVGLGWGAGTLIRSPAGEMIVCSIDRREALGPFDLGVVQYLDLMRPHLARAGLIAARLQLQRASTAANTLCLLGLPATVLNASGRVLSANDLMGNLASHVGIGAFNRLHFTDRNANTLLEQTLDAWREQAPGTVSSIPIQSADAGVILGHLVPVRRAAHDIFGGACLIVIFTPVARSSAPSEAILNGLFDLTPAEARVAKSVASGGSLRTIATDLGVSYETVRGQLKSTFAKTGTHSQSELTSLFGSLSAPSAWPVFL